MRLHHSRTKRRKFIVAVVVVAAIIVLHFVGILRPVENAIMYVVSPVFRTTGNASSGMRDTFGTLGNIRNLAKENEELKNKLENLEAENAQLAEIERENDALRELSNFPAREEYVLEPSFVIGYDPTSFTEYLTIDKGSESGIEENDPVVTESGNLIGRVQEVGWRSSKVLLITDSLSTVNAVVQDTRASGIVKGEHGLGMRMELIPQEEVIKVSDRVVTSGLSGVFPKGLTIGEIEDVQQKENELFQEARIRPFITFRNIEIAFVIKDF